MESQQITTARSLLDLTPRCRRKNSRLTSSTKQTEPTAQNQSQHASPRGLTSKLRWRKMISCRLKMYPNRTKLLTGNLASNGLSKGTRRPLFKSKHFPRSRTIISKVQNLVIISKTLTSWKKRTRRIQFVQLRWENFRRPSLRCLPNWRSTRSKNKSSWRQSKRLTTKSLLWRSNLKKWQPQRRKWWLILSSSALTSTRPTRVWRSPILLFGIIQKQAFLP